MSTITPVNSLVAALGTNGGTSGAMDTTGADFLVIAVSEDGTTTQSPTDSKSNTWVALGSWGTATMKVTFYYSENPTVGTGHTFTYSRTGSFSSIAVGAFATVKTSSPFDSGTDIGAGSASASTLQPGSKTPSENDCIVISGISFFDNSDPTIDSGFTRMQFIRSNFSTYYGVGLAYKIQTTAGAENPTWTCGDPSFINVNLAVFKSEPASGFLPRTQYILGQAVNRAASY